MQDYSEEDVAKSLEIISGKRENFLLQDSMKDPRPLYGNDYARGYTPEAYKMACAVFQFHTDETRWGWNWSNSKLLFHLRTTTQQWS